MNTTLWILLALNVFAICLAGIRANNRRIEEHNFWREYKDQNPDWADR